MTKNPSYSFKWATILFNYKDYQIIYRNGMWTSVEEIWVNDELRHRQASWKWRTQNTLQGQAISLYVKSGENEVFRLEPEKEIIGWKGLLICVAIGFLLGFFVLPLIFG
ncbi:MAG: hypothetical protein EBW94_05130 [Proteobacteria bacterium]|nr:hypothetical protein [Pseudomonadota bacterium]